jgi:hypothetical protein
MDQWSKLGTGDDESLAAYWEYYLDRVQALLGLR